MRFDQILYSVSKGIATITLNRPDRLSAFSDTMRRELIKALDQSDADAAVGAVVVTGAGRAFCAGQELTGPDTFAARRSRSGVQSTTTSTVRDSGGQLALRIFQSKKPIIAAINGAAVGVGVTMLLPMDFRIASNASKFSFVFVRRGIVPEAASTWFLPRLVGVARALDWCMTGRTLDVAEAIAGGLVSASHSDEELLPAAREIANNLMENCSPMSVSLTRQMLWHGLTFAHPLDAHRVESQLMAWRGRSDDAMEGVCAFLEKRRPKFPDRVSLKELTFPWNSPIRHSLERGRKTGRTDFVQEELNGDRQPKSK